MKATTKRRGRPLGKGRQDDTRHLMDILYMIHGTTDLPPPVGVAFPDGEREKQVTRLVIDGLLEDNDANRRRLRRKMAALASFTPFQVWRLLMEGRDSVDQPKPVGADKKRRDNLPTTPPTVRLIITLSNKAGIIKKISG